MRLFEILGVLNVVSSALAHGHIKQILVDGKVYWGYNPAQDEKFPSKRIAYAQKGSSPFIVNQTSPDMACNHNPSPPALIAPARAGSKINFMWPPWYASHKGPILSYMAPYEDSIDNVNVNALSFFKISERGLAPDNVTWAVDEMMANGNVTSTIIPHDIKQGSYILRHELIGLHYATEDSLYHEKADKLLGPQHYIQCFNIQVEGSGSAQPKGVNFPGAYKSFRQEPGLYFDIWRGVSPYPIPGPELYVPKGLPPVVEQSNSAPILQSPTGDAEKDKLYYAALEKLETRQNAFILNVNGNHLGYGRNPNMTGPPPGSVPAGAVVRGA